MLDFYQKRKARAVFNSRITQAVLLGVLTFLVWQAYERYTVAMMVGERRAGVEATAAELQARKDSLEAEVQYLQDDRGIEAEVRRQFDIALPGEDVVVILDDDDPFVVEPLSTTTKEQKSSWWPWY